MQIKVIPAETKTKMQGPMIFSNDANSLKIQKWKIWESIKITKIDTKIPEITWIVPFIEFINGMYLEGGFGRLQFIFESFNIK